MLCIGLDPDRASFPHHLGDAADATFRFCAEIVDSTADLVCAFKPQFAHFAARGEEEVLERLCAYIRVTYPDVVLILDAKRGDIGSTAEHYAREAFDRYGAHAVTVNPYLGTDSVEPFLRHGDGGVIVLCRTSNHGGADFQNLLVDGEPLYLHVARRVATEWNEIGECGLVVGATYPAELAAVRAAVGDLPMLVPGIGAQGGDVAAVVLAGADSTGRGLIVSNSRAVLYASRDRHFADAARRVAEATLQQMRTAAPAR